jgi:Bacterial export proteins, family 1
MEHVFNRNDADPGTGKRHGGVRPILLLDRATGQSQGSAGAGDRVPASSRGGRAANAHAEISFLALLGELAVGLVYGLTLALLNEMLLFAGQIAGVQFSFSLVNLMDPTSSI